MIDFSDSVGSDVSMGGASMKREGPADVAALQQDNGALGTFCRLNGVRCVMVVSNWAKKLFSSSPSVLLLAGMGLYSWLALDGPPHLSWYPIISSNRGARSV